MKPVPPNASTKHPASPMVVEAQAVCKSYENGRIPVLRHVNLSVRQGEIVALCGPSGCGKSTLLHLAGGLDSLDAGLLFIGGRPVHDMKKPLAQLRFFIGFIFQFHHLIPDLNLRENCLLPCAGIGMAKKTGLDRLLQLSKRVGIQDRLEHRIQDLSGGERQRAAICRALMIRPRLILADEPTGSLDEDNRELVFDLLLEIAREEQVGVLMATHDRHLAEKCDRSFTLKQGRAFEVGHD